jgi:TRAP-type transport system small permease protein
LRRLLATLCSAVAALALFAIMLLTLVDVGGRKLVSTSLTGALELTELLMVAVIFAAMPLVSLAGEHVVFDSLDALVPRWLRRIQHVLVELLSAALLGGLAWLMWVKAGQMIEYGDISAQLKLPLGPFVYLMSALLAITALIHLLLVVHPVAHRHFGVGEPKSLGDGLT